MPKKNNGNLIIVKVKRDKRFSTIKTDFMDNNKLSWKDKGLLGYFLTRPPGWRINRKDLIRKSTDGRNSIQTSIRNLETTGYLLHEQRRAKGGRFDKVVYTVFEDPKNVKRYTTIEDFLKLPKVDLPGAGFRGADNQPLSSYYKNLSKNKKESVRRVPRLFFSDHKKLKTHKLILVILTRLENDHLNISTPRNFEVRTFKPGNRYHTVLEKISNYILTLAKEHEVKSTILLFRDYFLSVYKYYSISNRLPDLHQFSPSDINKLNFEEWIRKWEKNNDMDYWGQA